jgi:hypothetical protein
MGFIPIGSRSPDQSGDSNAVLDACRPFFGGPMLSARELLAGKEPWQGNGKFVFWLEEPEARFNVWKSSMLDREVMLLFGHSPFLNNGPYGSCNQYFWLHTISYDRCFRGPVR